jgi:hypothetical protein
MSINLKDKREQQKRETWIKNTMSKLHYTREQAEAAWQRIFQRDH